MRLPSSCCKRGAIIAVMISYRVKIIATFFVSAATVGAETDFNSLKELKYRNIGPFRGGRVVAVSRRHLAAERLLFRRHRRRDLEDH